VIEPKLSIDQIQKEFCRNRGIEYVPSPSESNLGFALSTKGKTPINGLRHRPQGDTCGWYLWCGETFSRSPDFFSPLHVKHVYEDHSEIRKLLGLAPGYRFLLAGDYLDVWFDQSILVL